MEELKSSSSNNNTNNNSNNFDSSNNSGDLRNLLWQGAIPAVISLASADVASVSVPSDVHVSNLAYLNTVKFHTSSLELIYSSSAFYCAA